ncbi:MAG: Fe-S protein assembly co-chaperone HscB [Rubrivivax sp.]|nr:Fe-S protein assembly co-chaperone HscB [Rubrivivax sp.]MBK7263047.1 Fe-S protein assembly co-chaperone HscB [Rubrivivax sp.]MBK8527026.1 Fe-S protein assembly co-chaperone HscB [Rubrivivax sp.]
MKLDDDDFTLFDLPRRHALDRAEIDSRWRALQSQVHPDRFAAQGDAAQRLAMQWAVRVNQAHQRLKDPLRRAAYLCELAGVPIEAENNTAMPADFLMQQMAWREALDDAHEVADVQALEDEVEREERGLLADLANRLDLHNDPRAAAGQVRALMFVRRFRQDIERRLDRADH